MIKLKPPQHRADLGGTMISAEDSAWNLAKIADDRITLTAKALAEKQATEVERFTAENPDATPEELESIRAACVLSDAEEADACNLAPFCRYHNGQTRMQPSAPDTDGHGKPVTIREDYLTGKPDAEFSLRRLKCLEYAEVMEGAGGILSKMIAACKLGLSGIRMEGLNWKAKGDELVSEETIEMLHEISADLVVEIGSKVLRFSRPMDVSEGKH